MTYWLLKLVAPLCGTYGMSFGLNPSVMFARVAGGVLLAFVSSAAQSALPLVLEPGRHAILTFVLPANSLAVGHYEGRGDCPPQFSSSELCVMKASADVVSSEVAIRLAGESLEFSYAVRLEGGGVVAGSIRQTGFFVH
jgi:hypothetical protein